MPKYQIKKHNNTLVEVAVHLAKGENRFGFFHSPDHHWDNPKCDRSLLKRDLEKAIEDNYLIIMPGDTFCLMQGKGDRRGSKADVREEHNKNNYLQAVTKTAIEWYKPYAHQMIIGQGNHESGVLNRLEYDIIEAFSEGVGCVHAGYMFFVVFKVYDHANRIRAMYKVFCHHGSGGGGAVTRGQIEHSRQMMYVDADALSSGHVHEKNIGEVARCFTTDTAQENKVVIKPVLLLRGSTYKQEFTGSGYHTQNGRPPKPLGGVFVDCHLKGSDGYFTIEAHPHFRTTPQYTL